MRQSFALFNAAFLLTVAASPAFAQQRKQWVETASTLRVALVIGNSYSGHNYLSNSKNDAEAMAKALTDLGFRVILRTDRTKQQMRNDISEFGDALQEDCIALFYFSGHGAQVDGANYLIPTGFVKRTEQDIADDAIPATRPLAVMKSKKSCLNLEILDACRNNLFKDVKALGDGGLASMPAPRGTLIAYATQPGETALNNEAGKNSLFTQELLKEMQTPGLEVDRVLKNARITVAAKSDDKQIPWIEGGLLGDFYFVNSSKSSKGLLEARFLPSLVNMSNLPLPRFHSSATTARTGDVLSKSVRLPLINSINAPDRETREIIWTRKDSRAKIGSAVAGAPTAISTGGEYAVYAPVPATRGIIGIRGDSRAKIGGTVTNLQAKGNIGEVAAGTAVYAAAPSGKAASAGGNVKQKIEGTEKGAPTNVAPIKKDIVKIDTNIEQEQLASEKNVAQIAARATSKPEFDLPEGLRSQRVDKTVVAKVTVEADGSHDESIVEGSGNSELDSAVKAWLHRWRWEAAKQEGKPVKSSFKISIPIKAN